MGDIIGFVNSITKEIVTITWAIFFLAWAIGWGIKGSPIPIFRVKRAGQNILEDAILAAFWLAMGATVFGLISYLVGQIGSNSIPPSPSG
jgi:hypothetical protein